MNFATMTLEQINARSSEILELLQGDDLSLAQVEEFEEEYDKLEARRKEIENSVERRQALLNRVAGGAGTVIFNRNAETEEETIPGIDSPEYRSAFIKKLQGATLTDIEERTYVHNTTNTAAVIPKELEDRIYSNMEESHPILNDIRYVKSGAVWTISKHTAIVDGDAKVVNEGTKNDNEENTFVEVTLGGKKFLKHLDLTYELQAMATPAFEDYLVDEIGKRVGASVARYIFTQIKADLAVANKIDAATPGTLVQKDVLKALASLKGAGKVYVYTNNATFYGAIAAMESASTKISFIPNYQDQIAGQMFGKGIKEEDGVGANEIFFLDPQQFLFNEITGFTLERDRDIKLGVTTIAGHILGSGSMTNDKAGALLNVGVSA